MYMFAHDDLRVHAEMIRAADAFESFQESEPRLTLVVCQVSQKKANLGPQFVPEISFRDRFTSAEGVEFSSRAFPKRNGFEDPPPPLP